MKKIYRSQSDRVLAGVCGGFAEYFNIDPVLVRLIWIFMILSGGSGIIAYILGLLLIPENADHRQLPMYRNLVFINRKNSLWGIILILLGLILVFQYNDIIGRVVHRFWDFGFNLLFAVILIGFGVLLLSKGRSGFAKPAGLKLRIPFHISTEDRVFTGVCGGIAESLEIDSTIIRLILAFGTIMSVGAGIILYLVLALLLPKVNNSK